MSLFPANLNFRQGALEILGKIRLLRFLWLFVENFKSVIYHPSFLQGVVWICMKVYPVNLPSSWTRCALLCRDKARNSLKKKREEKNENREENPAKANMGMGTLNISWNMVVHELLVCFLARAWKRIGKKDRPHIWDWVSVRLHCLFCVLGFGYSQGWIRACRCFGSALTGKSYWALSLAGGGRLLLSHPPLPHTRYTLLPIASTNIGLKTVRITCACFFGCQRIVSLWYFCVTWVLPFYISFFPCRCVLWRYPIDI